MEKLQPGFSLLVLVERKERWLLCSPEGFHTVWRSLGEKWLHTRRTVRICLWYSVWVQKIIHPPQVCKSGLNSVLGSSGDHLVFYRAKL